MITLDINHSRSVTYLSLNIEKIVCWTCIRLDRENLSANVEKVLFYFDEGDDTTPRFLSFYDEFEEWKEETNVCNDMSVRDWDGEQDHELFHAWYGHLREDQLKKKAA